MPCSQSVGRPPKSGPPRRLRSKRQATAASASGADRVHERVGRIGLADRRIARQDRRVDRHLGELGQLEQTDQGRVDTDRRCREHERHQPVVGTLRVSGGDQAAERVPDHHDGQSGMLGAGELDDEHRVVDEQLDVLDDALLALGSAVTVVVAGVDRGALVHKRLRDVVVPARMLGQTVDDHGDERGVVAAPAVQLEAALAAGDLVAHPRNIKGPGPFRFAVMLLAFLGVATS